VASTKTVRFNDEELRQSINEESKEESSIIYEDNSSKGNEHGKDITLN
jgi:hypothetical protein